MLRIIVGLGIIILAMRQPAAKLEADGRNMQEEKEKTKLDVGAAFDRIATRFGAFAIVAAISYPLVRSSMAVKSARPYELPAIENNSGTFIMMLGFSGLMMLVTLIIGISTFTPIMTWFERKLNAARVLWAILLGAILAITVLLYILIMTMVIFSSSLSPALDDVSDLLQHLPVCGNYRLSGTICEQALTICHKASEPSGCREEVGKYVDALHPRTGIPLIRSSVQEW